MTSPGFDDIGEVLNTMGVTYEPFSGSYDCDLLFVNCGQMTGWIQPACSVSSRRVAACTPPT